VEEGLVVAGLELLGDDQDAEGGLAEAGRRLALREAVHARLGELQAGVIDAPGEGDEGPRVGVALLREVGVDGLLVADRMEAR